MSGAFPRLLAPLRLGAVELRNRIVSTAHGVRLARDHAPSERDVAYYTEKAVGGVGLIVQEAIRVHPTSVPSAGAIIGYDRSVLPHLRVLAEAVHEAGVPLIGQICHQGRQTSSAYMRTPLWAPSAIPGFYNHERPHAMDAEEIEVLVQAHADTAALLLEAGYDGVEIHAGHGYLLQQFLSPLSNRRSDGYGGSLANRARLMAEVLSAVRRVAGEALVGLRLGVEEFLPGGLCLEEACAALLGLLERERIDYVSVTQSSYEAASIATMVPDMHVAPAGYVQLAKSVKQAVGQLPVLAVGRIDSPATAERVLADTGVDLVGMTRAQIADPQLGRKATEGRAERIRPCVALNVCWRTAVAEGMPITCAVNPVAGREREWGAGTLRCTSDPATVVVLGGGPAGLEAARVLALAGHRVVLFERERELGGQLLLAALAPQRGTLALWPRWAAQELHRTGVEVRLGVQAGVEDVVALAPDAVLLASGSRASLGDIELAPGATALSGRDVLAGIAVPAGRVLVVDRDWEWQAPTVAEHLAEAGHEVIVSTEKLHLGVRIPASSLTTMLARMDQRGIEIHPQLRAVSFRNGVVHLRHSFSGSPRAIDGIAAIVVAGESVAEDSLLQPLRDACAQVHAIGDCVAPRQLVDAVYGGHAVARELVQRWAAASAA